jgi:hypothetical protein
MKTKKEERERDRIKKRKMKEEGGQTPEKS